MRAKKIQLQEGIESILENLSPSERERFLELNGDKRDYPSLGSESGSNDKVPASLPELFRWGGFKHALSQDTDTFLQIFENGERYWVHHPLRKSGKLVYGSNGVLRADSQRNGLVVPSLVMQTSGFHPLSLSEYILGSGISGNGLEWWGEYGNDRFAATLLTKNEFEKVRKFLPSPECGDLNGLCVSTETGIYKIKTSLQNMFHLYAFNVTSVPYVPK